MGRARNSSWVLLLLLVLACARIEAPPGGPPDETAPRVLAQSPPSGSVNQPLRPEFIFQFDEYLNRGKAANELRLSPEHPGGLDIRWRGRTMRVRPNEPLLPDQTYVLEVGSGLSDISGNPLPQSIQLAFSTGARLDSFSLAGRLSTTSRGARPLLSIWPLAEFPRHPGAAAAWQTRPDPDGNFRMANLKEQSYRVFAFDDQNGNRRWDYPQEAAATADRDVIPGTEAPLSMRLAPMLLDSLALQSIEVLDRYHLRLRARLDQPRASGRAARLNLLSLRDTLGRYLQIHDLKQEDEHTMLLLTDPMDSLNYVLYLAETLDSLRFMGSTRTLNSFGGWRREGQIDFFGSMRWRTELGLQQKYKGQAWLVQAGDSAVAGVRFEDSWTVLWRMSRKQDGDTLILTAGSFEDRAGQSWPDSTLHFPLQASVPLALGSAELLLDRMPQDPWRLAVLKGDSLVKEAALAPVVLLDELPEGLLKMALYLDSNGDRHWSAGELDPFRHAEIWLELPADTLRILAGWTQEEQRLELPMEVR